MSIYGDILGREPGSVVRPTTYDEVCAIVAEADATGKSVIPRGGGSGQSYGYLPQRADILLDMTGLNREIAHEPGDLTITVEAGVRPETVTKTLWAHRQYLQLPQSANDLQAHTVGGILAYGNHPDLRDTLIGITVVDARGEIIKGGGKVVKNVTGYDIPKLHIGALGTLGIIVEATFKVSPVPEATAKVRCDMAKDADIAPFWTDLQRETEPGHRLITEDEAGKVVWLSFAGFREGVTADLERFEVLTQRHRLSAWEMVSDSGSLPKHPTDAPLILQIGALPANLFAVHRKAVELTGVQAVHTTQNVTLFAKPDADIVMLYSVAAQIARSENLSLTVLHALLEMRRGEYDLWSPLPASFPLMRRLKETLDPNRTLNPGRFVGRL